jgi:hypothetical protein
MTVSEIEAAFLCGAVAALCKRAASCRERASSGVSRDAKGNTILTSESAALLSWGADWSSIADELEAVARR